LMAGLLVPMGSLADRVGDRRVLLSGLGISLFGVFMSSVFSRTVALPADLSRPQAEQAARSVSDSYVVAQELSETPAAALIDAAQRAFSSSHATLLATSAALIDLLAVVVFAMLGSYRPHRPPADAAPGPVRPGGRESR
jgi:DHA2 family multidrug resistance protein-like MFS transporter